MLQTLEKDLQTVLSCIAICNSSKLFIFNGIIFRYNIYHGDIHFVFNILKKILTVSHLPPPASYAIESCHNTLNRISLIRNIFKDEASIKVEHKGEHFQ